MALVNNLSDLETLLKLLKESDVKVFKSTDLTLILENVFETEEDPELDEKPQMGFGSTDLRDLGVSTEFDE